MITALKVPVDIEQRKLALDATKSFICEAPAGSGKTELLTQRVLTLLNKVEKPESILAITFTRKAAAEMRERILSALERGMSEEPVDEYAKNTWLLAKAVLKRDRQLNWQILQNPNRLQIRTFDSLCSMLTQALPLHSSLGAKVGVCSDADLLYKESIRELMETLEQNVPWAPALKNLLSHLDNSYVRVEELLLKMLRTRDTWMPIINISEAPEFVRQRLESHLRSALKDKKFQLINSINSSQLKRLLQFAGFAASNLTAERVDSPIVSLYNIEVNSDSENFEELVTVEQWRGLAALLLTQSGDWRRKLDKRCGFPPGTDKDEKVAFKQKKTDMEQFIGELSTQSDFFESLQGVQYWPAPEFDDSQWLLLESLTLVLPILIAQLQLVFRAHGEVDFLEMSTRAHQALGDEQNPTDLALRLDHSIQHILADEFQDTSFTQVELLQKLSMGWQDGDGRTLFCVGDAMQSIYGFRGANVGLFLRCKKFGLGAIKLHPIQLTTNFRSQAGIVDWVNKTFQNAFPSENDITSGAVVFSKADAFRAKSDGASVQTLLYSKECSEDFEGNKVVELISRIHSSTPDATIAILVRSKKHAESSVNALKSAGLRFRAVDLEPLSHRPVIQDLLAFTLALLFVDDRVAWLSILRAPWCGLTLTDLSIIAQQRSASPDELVIDQIEAYFAQVGAGTALSDYGHDSLSRNYEVLAHALNECERKPLRQWLEGSWIQIGGAACLTSHADCENAERYFQCLEEIFASGELPTRSVLLESVDKLFAAPDPEADDSIQIMTIHKSKGLEFDVVILPGLHRPTRPQDAELLLWQERLSLEGNEEWLLGPISEIGQEKDAIYNYLEHEKARREKLEACRLLYVACTRAKRQLFLLAEASSVEQEVNVFKPPATKSLLSPIWPMVKDSIETHFFAATENNTAAVDLLRTFKSLVRLPEKWRLPSLPQGHLLDAYVAASVFDNSRLSTERMTMENQLPRQMGTLIHQILQLIGKQGIAVWQHKDLFKLMPFWRTRLASFGATESEVSTALPVIATCIDNVLKSKHFQWLMSGDCQFEYPLSTRSSEGFEQSIIDLLMVDDEGTAWVVDYKTSAPEVGESISDFLQREKATYLPQIERYRHLIENLGFKLVKGSLYFVLLDKWLEY